MSASIPRLLRVAPPALVALAAGLSLGAAPSPPSSSSAAASGPNAAPTTAELSWPQWRGPRHDGTAPHGAPPLTWSESENVRVKVSLPGEGLASPIVWGDRIFLTAAVPVGEALPAGGRGVAPRRLSLEVLAFSRADGRLLWRRAAAERTPHEGHHADGSWASASPVTDGEVVVAHFGSLGTYAFSVDGEPRWSLDLGDMTTRNGFGEGSSPFLAGDTLLINWDHEGDSFLVALDVATGRERWRVERPEEPTSWSTPLVVEAGGRRQVVVASTGRSRAYDLETGAELWSVGGMTYNVVPTPLHHRGLVYLMSGFRGNTLQAIDAATAKGRLEDTAAIRFTFDRHTPYVPSAVVAAGGLWFLKSNTGILTQLDAATGAVRFTEHRLAGVQNVYASPVAAAGRVYVVGRDGATAVLAAGPEPKQISTNVLDDRFDASPAIAGPDLVLRGHRSLYVLAEKAAAAQGGAAGTGSR